MFSQLLYNLQLVAWNGDRGIYLIGSYTQLQELTLMSAGLVPSVPSNVALFKSRMLSYINKLDLTNQQLYASVDYASLHDIVNLYTVPSIAVKDLIPGTYVSRDAYNATTRVVNLVSGVVELIVSDPDAVVAQACVLFKCPCMAPLQADSHRTYTLPVENISISDPQTFWVLHNAWTALSKACNSSTFLANELSHLQATTIITANSAVVAVSLALFAIVALVVMVPAALRALRTQKAIFESLLEVPLPIVSALNDRTAAKIELIRKEAEAATLGLDVDELADDALPSGVVFEDDEGFDVTEKPAVVSTLAPGDILQAAISDAAHRRARHDGLTTASSLTAAPSCRICCCCRTQGGRANGHARQRHFRNADSSRNIVLVSLLWPIVVYSAFFIGMYLWRLQLVTFASFAKEEVWNGNACFRVAGVTSSLAPHPIHAGSVVEAARDGGWRAGL